MKISYEFIHIFETLEDPRIENHNFKHKMIDVLVLRPKPMQVLDWRVSKTSPQWASLIKSMNLKQQI